MSHTLHPGYSVATSDMTSLADAIRARMNSREQDKALTFPDEMIQKIQELSDDDDNGLVDGTATILSGYYDRVRPYAFKFYLRLSSVWLGGTQEIGSEAFYCCYYLSSVTFSSRRYMSIGPSAFRQCSRLSSFPHIFANYIGWHAFSSTLISYMVIDFPDVANPSESDGLYRIEDWAFGGMSSLSTIIISGGNSFLSLGSNIFGNSLSIYLLQMPDFTGTIPSNAIQCSGIRMLNIGVSVVSSQMLSYINPLYQTVLEEVALPGCITVSSSAFLNASALTSVFFWSNIKTINTNAFRSCHNLKDFYLDDVTSVPTLATSTVFTSTPIDGYSDVAGDYGSIYVPASLYSAFTTATNWSRYSARMVSV